jgi:hypothetical protein
MCLEMCPVVFAPPTCLVPQASGLEEKCPIPMSDMDFLFGICLADGRKRFEDKTRDQVSAHHAMMHVAADLSHVLLDLSFNVLHATWKGLKDSSELLAEYWGKLRQSMEHRRSLLHNVNEKEMARKLDEEHRIHAKDLEDKLAE